MALVRDLSVCVFANASTGNHALFTGRGLHA